MNNDQNSFSLRVETALENLLDRITENDALVDLDADLVDGVLRIDFDDGGVIVISRQVALQQIWVATPQGPAHFVLDKRSDTWMNDRTQESLSDFLGRAITHEMKFNVVVAEPL